MERLLNTTQLAERLNVKRNTVTRNARTIPGAIKMFGRWRFDPVAIEAWIAASRESPDTWAKPTRGAA
jgi:hypothetical protein